MYLVTLPLWFSLNFHICQSVTDWWKQRHVDQTLWIDFRQQTRTVSEQRGLRLRLFACPHQHASHVLHSHRLRPQRPFPTLSIKTNETLSWAGVSFCSPSLPRRDFSSWSEANHKLPFSSLQWFNFFFLPPAGLTRTALIFSTGHILNDFSQTCTKL